MVTDIKLRRMVGVRHMWGTDRSRTPRKTLDVNICDSQAVDKAECRRLGSDERCQKTARDRGMEKTDIRAENLRKNK